MISETNPSMPQWLSQRARLTPDRIAFETAEEQLTFKQLLTRVRQAASVLRSVGVHPADHVASLQGNTLPCAVTVHALMMLGAVMVPLNTRLSVNELAEQIQDSGCHILITDQKYDKKASQAIERINCALIHTEKWTDCEPLPDDFDKEIQLGNPCTIIFTSGTTGHPKGVVLTYGNHWWNANASLINLGLSPDDKWLCCVPLFHVSGLSILIKSVIYGMPVYLQKKFDPQSVNQLITDGGITHISVVASMLQRMMNAIGDQNAYPKSLRCILLGGGPVPKSLLQHCLDQEMPVYQTYGMSETASQAVTLPPEYMLEKAGSAGQPLFPLQVRISATVPHEPGEILIKGPTVFSHYLNNPEATRIAFDGEWFHSGDIGYLDEDGFLFVLDRRKDLIISGGENIYPAEVESVLNGFAGILRAGVIGVPDKEWGHVPIAFVSLKEGVNFSESELMNRCKAHLAAYKVPKRIFALPNLPENASHKLLRRKLYEQYEKMNRVK